VSEAKEAILGRVRGALGSARKPDAREAEYAAVVRDYRTTSDLDQEALLALFVERLSDYGALVHPCSTAETGATVGQVLSTHGKQGLLIPGGLPQSWLPAGFAFTPELGLSYAEMDRSEGVLTGCAAAIALTGTIIIRHSAEAGSRALTLIPDYHLCVVHAEQVVHTVPEGIRQLSSFGTAPLTTISGPSATSDIEMTRIKGVHGPRTLEVVLVQ
jgi:L-lactate dehydrogenase complex protein LldG